jgi:hypothetical protein
MEAMGVAPRFNKLVSTARRHKCISKVVAASLAGR